MSRIYLVRHGQAGTRQVYDELSDVGRQQMRRLGEYFRQRDIHFDTAYQGGLTRQQQSAAETAAAYGEGFPSIVTDDQWNEFDLDRVYKELAALLCEEDPEFRREFEHNANAHRRWTSCDIKMVQTWLKGHPQYTGESWLDFHQRIAACRPRISGENIVVFTSGTPIGIWAALSLDVDDHRAMRLAGTLHNASFTEMRLREDGALRLHSFNSTPHLEPELLTYR